MRVSPLWRRLGVRGRRLVAYYWYHSTTVRDTCHLPVLTVSRGTGHSSRKIDNEDTSSKRKFYRILLLSLV